MHSRCALHAVDEMEENKTEKYGEVKKNVDRKTNYKIRSVWFQLFLIKPNENAMFMTSLYSFQSCAVVATNGTLRTNCTNEDWISANTKASCILSRSALSRSRSKNGSGGMKYLRNGTGDERLEWSPVAAKIFMCCFRCSRKRVFIHFYFVFSKQTMSRIVFASFFILCCIVDKKNNADAPKNNETERYAPRDSVDACVCKRKDGRLNYCFPLVK